MKTPESRWWILAPIAVMIGIQLASGLPHPSHVTVHDGFSSAEVSAARILFSPGEKTVNLLHAPVFAVLTWLWCWALSPWQGSRRRLLSWVGAMCLAFAFANELSQLVVPTRTAALHDVAADVIGIAIGLAVFFVMGSTHRI